MARPRKAGMEREIDGLFRLPLDRFVEERNLLAKRVPDAEQAARIRSLQKPGVPAWTVNQLYGSHRRELDRLLDAGRRLRRVQEGGGGTARLQEASRARREALSSLMNLAEQTLEGGDHKASRATLRRVSATLEALAAGADPDPVGGPGRLHQELSPPGFEALLAPPRGKARGRRERTPAARPASQRRKRSLQALRGAEAEVTRAQRGQERAMAARDAALDEAGAARLGIERARDQLTRAERHGRRAVAAHRRRETQARDADRAVARARKALEKARARVKKE